MQAYSKFVTDIDKYDLSHIPVTYNQFTNMCNGCGSKGGFKFPSTMWLVNIEVACNIHDVDWSKAQCWSDLLKANERFDNNLKIICDDESNWFMIPIRRQRIAKYVTGVELYGTVGYALERGFDIPKRSLHLYNKAIINGTFKSNE